jgi:hypothetical protein
MSKRKPARRSAKQGTGKAADAANHVAALRWYLLGIERRAYEVLITEPGAYERVRSVLSRTLLFLEELEPVRSAAGCPHPWQLCDDDVCRPECDDVRVTES